MASSPIYNEATMTREAALSADKRTGLLAGFIMGLFVLFMAELGIGLLLETHYSATDALAYKDVQAMQASGMHIVRAFHYWSSTVLIIGSVAALIAMVFARWFSGERARIWVSTALLFLASLLSQISGNLLPFDHHAVQTAVVESGIARQAPIAGASVSNVILGGSKFGEQTIGQWHVGHIGFCLVGIIGAVLFWSGSRRLQKHPAFLFAPLLIGCALCLIAPAPLGNQASSADFSQFGAQVSWYTWPLHGSLHLFMQISPTIGWIGSIVIPTLFAILIALAPWISQRLSPKVFQVGFLGFGAYFMLSALFFGGRFAPLTGNRDPATAVSANVSQDPAKLDPALVGRGRQLFNSNACAGCHGQDGNDGASGSEGPNLTGVSKRRGTDPGWYMKFIKNPASVSPNTTMPAFPELTDDQTRAIAEFLISR